MTKEETDVLADLKASLAHLSEVAKGISDESTRAIINTQIFIMIGKVRWLLGER